MNRNCVQCLFALFMWILHFISSVQIFARVLKVQTYSSDQMKWVYYWTFDVQAKSSCQHWGLCTPNGQILESHLPVGALTHQNGSLYLTYFWRYHAQNMHGWYKDISNSPLFAPRWKTNKSQNVVQCRFLTEICLHNIKTVIKTTKLSWQRMRWSPCSFYECKKPFILKNVCLMHFCMQVWTKAEISLNNPRGKITRTTVTVEPLQQVWDD